MTQVTWYFSNSKYFQVFRTFTLPREH